MIAKTETARIGVVDTASEQTGGMGRTRAGVVGPGRMLRPVRITLPVVDIAWGAAAFSVPVMQEIPLSWIPFNFIEGGDKISVLKDL